MSWSIEDMVNDVTFKKACKEELEKVSVEVGRDLYFDKVKGGYKISFNPDDMEYMDWLDEPELLEVLKKHKVEGDICFGSLEGDNNGSFWGYRFDGEGNMSTLSGSVEWVVDYTGPEPV